MKQNQTTPEPTCLVRRCEICGNVNAVDIVSSFERECEMKLEGHEVLRVPENVARRMWETAARCDHKTLIEDLREEVARWRSIYASTAVIPAFSSARTVNAENTK